MRVKTDIKELNFKIFKIKDVLYADTPNMIGCNVVRDTNKNNGVVKYTLLNPIHKGGCITFSSTANGNVFYQPDDFIMDRDYVDTLYVFRGKMCPLENNENVALFLVTVLKKCCEGRNVGVEYRLPEILNWKIALPARCFEINGKKSKPVVDYQAMDAYIQSEKQKIILKAVEKLNKK